MSKLTAIVLTSGCRKLQCFIVLPYHNGRPVLSLQTLDKLLDDLGVMPGEGYSIGRHLQVGSTAS